MIQFVAGECLDIFGREPDSSFDAFVCDWPAGVAFMGRAWDRDHGGRDAWVREWAKRAAMMRAKAKPGAYALVWALPRTSHWTMTALEDAGWTIQDVIVHVTGQGWPKGKSALKPSQEAWIVARKPIAALDYVAIIGAWLSSVSSVAMATSLSSPLGNTNSNIVSSWQLTLGDVSQVVSTCTTGMASSLTTDLRTLSCSLSKSTLASTDLERSSPNGSTSRAEDVARIFVVLQAKCDAIRLLSATEIATSGLDSSAGSVSVSRPGETDRRTAPGSEHWILARNGSGGALQIDAARVARGERPEMVRTPTLGMSNARSGASLGGTASGDITTLGSWPPNFALSHCPECEERGTRRVKGANATTGVWRGGGKLYGDHRAPADAVAYNDPDGLETVPAFDCLAACDCGLSRLATAGGQAPRCACGAAMWWCCPVAEMDAQSSAKGMHSAGGRAECGSMNNTAPIGYGGSMVAASFRHGDTENGSAASRFFPRFAYQAKAAGGERHAGCEDLYWRADRTNPFGFVRVTRAEWEALPEGERAAGNVHPTVKSLELMRWLVALVTPPGGRCGDITAGSGGTGLAIHLLNEAARATGAAPMSFLGADICPEAVEIAEARLAWWRKARHDAKPKKPTEKPASAQVSIFDVRP